MTTPRILFPAAVDAIEARLRNRGNRHPSKPTSTGHCNWTRDGDCNCHCSVCRPDEAFSVNAPTDLADAIVTIRSLRRDLEAATRFEFKGPGGSYSAWGVEVDGKCIWTSEDDSVNPWTDDPNRQQHATRDEAIARARELAGLDAEAEGEKR